MPPFFFFWPVGTGISAGRVFGRRRLSSATCVGVLGVFRQVLVFVRVGVLVVKLGAGGAVVPFGIAPALGADAVAHDSFAAALAADDLGDGGLGPACFGIHQQRTQALAFKVGWRGESAQIG